MAQAPVRAVDPVVQRLRLRYAKRGRLRFSSHRDFQRAFERALRRAEIPIAFSAGFTPHPKVSYAGAAPTGVASEAEYVEIGVRRECDPAEVRRALDQALPPGLDVEEVVEARTSDLVGRLQASVWRIELPGVGLATLQRAATALVAAESVQVERLTKNGIRRFDARGPIVSLRASTSDTQQHGEGPAGDLDDRTCAILTVVVRHVTPSVRPDDVLAAMRQVADLAPQVPPRVTRLAQGPIDADGAGVGDPLADDRRP